MSRGASPLFNPAEAAQQPIAQAQQTSVQQQQIRAQQAMAAQRQRSQEQMQREQLDLARQQGLASNAVQLAGITATAQSQEDYRKLLAEKARIEADVARERMGQEQSRFEEEQSFEREKYSELLAMKDEEIQLEAKKARALGESQLRYEEELAEIRKKRSAFEVAMIKAQTMLRTGNENVSEDLRKIMKGLDDEILKNQIVVDKVGASIADSLASANWIESQDLSAFGIDSDRLSRAGTDILKALNPTRWFFEDLNTRQRMVLEALGEDTGIGEFVASNLSTGSPEFKLEAIAGVAGMLGMDTGVEPLGAREVLNRRMASGIANALGGIQEDSRGIINQGLQDIFRSLSDDPTSIQDTKKKLVDLAAQAKVSPLILQSAIQTAGRQLDARRKALMTAGVPDSFEDLEGLDDERDYGAAGTMTGFGAYVSKKIFGGQNATPLILLGESVDSIDSLTDFRESLGAEIERDEGFRVDALQDLLQDYEGPAFGTDFSGLETGLAGLRSQERGIEDMLRQRETEEIFDEDIGNLIKNRANRRATMGEVEAIEELIAGRRARRTGQ